MSYKNNIRLMSLACLLSVFSFHSTGIAKTFNQQDTQISQKEFKIWQKETDKGTTVGFVVPPYPKSNSFADADAAHCCVSNGCEIQSQHFSLGTDSTLTDGTDGVCYCDLDSNSDRVAGCLMKEIADYLSK